MSAVYFAEGANASFKEFVSVFTYVRPCVFVCNRVFSCCGPLSPAQRWPRSCCSVVVISQFACLCGSAAPLVLSLIPGSGKHQPLKLKRQGFFFSIPLLYSSHQIWRTAGAAMMMICLPLPVCLTGWERAHTATHSATQTLPNRTYTHN